MNILERLIFQPRGGMYREFEGLTTHLEPEDLSLYRALLPQSFGMPNQPVVTIFVADHVRVGPWPLTRYQEWAVLLRCECRGEMGWYCVTIPVSKWLPMRGGRYLGFPKYVADEITLARSGESRAATAKHRGVEQLALDFKPGTTRQLAPWERELAEDKAFFKEGDFYLLVPPGQGPRIRRISLDSVSEPTWSPEHGMIRVRVNPSQSWAGLIPNEGPFPGTYNHFIGGASLGAVWLS
jgi:hypothetical protein